MKCFSDSYGAGEVLVTRWLYDPLFLTCQATGRSIGQYSPPHLPVIKPSQPFRLLRGRNYEYDLGQPLFQVLGRD
ncbi:MULTISPECIES: hypothetical protein [unclassified Pseudomonas]|uniref:hypothetical protein n=1 Tax=unclassified Pseudomonas TaxID=196821 RepID=UPI002B23D7BD|nr:MULTISPECIES: hypothetical protein [unclassified Pseudomonas]MEA9975593.1 hypothetical protein [Pseudomonas sp. RTS4]MEB0198841.1 hypothetical protein [Pseudomonas sp. 5S4]MEB0245131.1 hypothetical protein [Pseudomonas sp. 10S5]